jgi:hypothetical protein
MWPIFNTQDIDIVVSEKGFNAEQIKKRIAREDTRYYLEQIDSRIFRLLGLKYHKLYCRLPGWATDTTRRVKVDILVPPTINLPAISASERHFFKHIPVMPIFDLLVMKTQGWRDHHISNREDSRDKEDNDVSDIVALLKRAKYEKVWFVNEADESRHSPEFMIRAHTLVDSFVSVHGRRQQWRAIGFDV